MGLDILCDDSWQPHATVDPVLTAAHVVVALQSVVSRSIKSADQALLHAALLTMP